MIEFSRKFRRGSQGHLKVRRSVYNWKTDALLEKSCIKLKDMSGKL